MRYITIVLPIDGPLHGQCNTKPIEASSPADAARTRFKQSWTNKAATVLVVTDAYTHAFKWGAPPTPTVVKA